VDPDPDQELAGVVLKIPVVARVVEVVGTCAILDVVGAGVVLKVPVVAREVVEVVGAWVILDVVGADVILEIPVVAREVVEVIGAWVILDVVGAGVVLKIEHSESAPLHPGSQRQSPCSPLHRPCPLHPHGKLH
jgi:hypothetical protein